MKKSVYIIFSVLCLLLCAVPAVGFMLKGPSEGGANEVMRPKPSLENAGGGLNMDYPAQLADYFNQRFYPRRELISAHNMLVTKLFSTSPVDSVIEGRDGWLYYGSTLETYCGTGAMSDDEINAAAENLAGIYEYCKGQGVDFLFTAAPNKNSIYPDNMPPYPRAGGDSDCERLYAALDELCVPYLNLHKVFREQEEVLYFAHDSHWNSKGAALAADAIMSALGRDSGYFAGGFSKSESHQGDLFEMLYPAFADSEENPVYGGALVCEYSGPSRADSIRLSTKGAGEGRLLCYRDSFGNLLHPYLADSFGSADFSRATSYDLSRAGDYDCVVIELVERNLRYLIEYDAVFKQGN